MSKSIQRREDIRRLQVTGGSTYILSLPKKWVTQMSLDKGSRVSLMKQDDGSILIMPEYMKKIEREDKAIILCRPLEDHNFVIRKLASAYLVGYNEIVVRAKNDRLDFNLRNEVKDFTRKKLVGTEIIADSPSEVILKVLLGYPELSVENALRRMSIITASMHKDVMEALREGNTELAEEVIYLDDEVDRFGFYIVRQLKAAVESPIILKEIGLSTTRNCLGYRLITKSVERTADHAVEIAKNILSLNKPLEPELYDQIESMSASAISIFNETIDALYRQDFEFANEIVRNAKRVAFLRNELMKSVMKKTDIGEVACLSLIIESVTRVAEYSSDIAEIILNLNIIQNLSA